MRVTICQHQLIDGACFNQQSVSGAEGANEIVSGPVGDAEGSPSQSGRESGENRCRPMRTHRHQSLISRDGLFILFYLFGAIEFDSAIHLIV